MSSRHTTEKVSLSFSNWVLGGSLVSVRSVETPPPLPLPRRTARKMVMVEVDSNGNAIRPYHIKSRKAKDDNLQEEKKKDGTDSNGEEKEKSTKMCKTCKACKTCKGRKTSSGERDDATVVERESDWDSKWSNSKIDSKLTSNDSEKKNDKTNIQTMDQIDRSGGWTESQDETIINMKVANKSWKEIAAEVGATRKEVSERFKLLQEYADALHNNNAGQDEGWQGSNTKDQEPDGNVEVDWSGLFEDDDKYAEKNQSPKKGNNNNNNNSNDNNNKSNSSNKNKQDKQHQQFERWEPNDNNTNSGETFKNTTQVQHKGSLQPDLIWDRDTCEMLEFFEAKYEQGKWMQIQADFYNWSGRMVSAEMIEKKFRDDGAGSGAGAGAGAASAERW